MNKISRIQELVNLCSYHSNLYYTKDKPEISDKEYDLLYTELSALEQQTGYILSSSPTQKVQGELLDSLVKVQHSEPMLSAEKSKDINDVKKFMGDKECVLSWKLDGLTIVLRYDKGKLQQAITRGGGDFGEDVTHTVKTFTNIPLWIDYDGYLEIRGEGLVTFKDFERINNELIAKGEEIYKSPRNLAAGSVRNLDSKIAKNRNMIFLAFGIVRCDKSLIQKDLQFAFLQELGFGVVEGVMTNKNKINEQIEWFKNKIQYLDYLTDGLIVEYNDIAYSKAQGSTGHHSKALYALKWSDDSVETKFLGVELNTTRTGMCSITGLFKEVDIDGVNVSRASLHNVDIFESLQLGVDDVITVYRANAVIPQIEDNLTRSGTYKIDMHCPSCGSNLIIKQPKEARFLFCENENCPSKLAKKFSHFVSRDAMNIDGFSEAGIETFLDKGWIETFADLYRIDRYKSDIIRTEGFGIRSYEKLIQAIEKSKNVKFENFVYALGISQIGKGGAKRLAKHFKNDIQTFLKATASHHNFTGIDDFGLITAYSVYEYFQNETNMQMANELLEYITIMQDKPKEIANTDSFFSGKKIYCTGSFASYKKDKLKSILEGLGAEFTSGYAKSLDYLIVGSIKGSSKEDKAKKDGVKIMAEDEFLKIIGQ